MDKLDPERRSQNMARVHGKNTEPEMRVRRIAHRIGLRFRLHRADLPGRPDLVFPRYRLAVFVHGCFWHRHTDCSRASMPATRREFWKAKFEANVARDRTQQAALLALGWTVLVLWECELKDESSIEKRLRAAIDRLCPSN
ncbi:very short patch repair endonuclease [Stappia sp. BW2]|uniref:very short patch repair endonuclease n=1 Tax=Stappia sp. BW2 TaxID=2592622 RepID=UPI00336AD13F